MPLFYLRRLTGRTRTESANRHLAHYLAFVAGAVNAGGFLAVQQYTSHMSGIVSAMADSLASCGFRLALHGLSAVVAFLLGALVATVLIHWARARELESQYALVLVVEASLLIVFGMVGKRFTGDGVLGTVTLLCFTMGLQNAMITKLSNAVIRTTHLTGMVTDSGIALGRIVMARLQRRGAPIDSETAALRLLLSLIALFFVGGVTGAFGFRYVGFLFTLPLAAGLVVLAAVPVADDLRRSQSVAG